MQNVPIGNKGQNKRTIDKLHTTNNGIIPIKVNNGGECNVNEGEIDTFVGEYINFESGHFLTI